MDVSCGSRRWTHLPQGCVHNDWCSLKDVLDKQCKCAGSVHSERCWRLSLGSAHSCDVSKRRHAVLGERDLVWGVRQRGVRHDVRSFIAPAVAQVRAQLRSYGICGGQSGTGAGHFLQVLRFLMLIIPLTAPYASSSTTRAWYNRPNSGLSLTPPQKKKTLKKKKKSMVAATVGWTTCFIFKYWKTVLHSVVGLRKINCLQSSVKGKESYPCNRAQRSTGLWDVEASPFST
jgi:hypothetical protein